MVTLYEFKKYMTKNKKLKIYLMKNGKVYAA